MTPEEKDALAVAHSALLSDYRGLLGAAIPAAVVAPIIAEDAQRWLAPTMCPDGRPVQATLSTTPLRDGAVPPGQELLCWRRALVARDPLSAATLARSLSVSARPLSLFRSLVSPPSQVSCPGESIPERPIASVPAQDPSHDEWYAADDLPPLPPPPAQAKPKGRTSSVLPPVPGRSPRSALAEPVPRKERSSLPALPALGVVPAKLHQPPAAKSASRRTSSATRRQVSSASKPTTASLGPLPSSAPSSAALAVQCLPTNAFSNIEDLTLEIPSAKTTTDAAELITALGPQLLRLSFLSDGMEMLPMHAFMPTCQRLRYIKLAFLGSTNALSCTLPDVLSSLSLCSLPFLVDVVLEGLRPVKEDEAAPAIDAPPSMRRLSVHWAEEAFDTDFSLLTNVLSRHRAPLRLTLRNCQLKNRKSGCPAQHPLGAPVPCVTHLNCESSTPVLLSFPAVSYLRTTHHPHLCSQCQPKANEHKSALKELVLTSNVQSGSGFWKAARSLEVVEFRVDFDSADGGLLQPKDIPSTLTTIRIHGGLTKLAAHLHKHFLVAKIKRVDVIGCREFLDAPDVVAMRGSGCSVSYVPFSQKGMGFL